MFSDNEFHADCPATVKLRRRPIFLALCSKKQPSRRRLQVVRWRRQIARFTIGTQILSRNHGAFDTDTWIWTGTFSIPGAAELAASVVRSIVPHYRRNIIVFSLLLFLSASLRMQVHSSSIGEDIIAAVIPTGDDSANHCRSCISFYPPSSSSTLSKTVEVASLTVYVDCKLQFTAKNHAQASDFYRCQNCCSVHDYFRTRNSGPLGKWTRSQNGFHCCIIRIIGRKKY